MNECEVTLVGFVSGTSQSNGKSATERGGPASALEIAYTGSGITAF